MNLKRISQRIYLIAVTFIYMVAVLLILVGIVTFAILSEISKEVKLFEKNKPSKSKKSEYLRVFKPIETQTLSMKEKRVLTISGQKK
ncbi:MAG: hypothetical protein SWJ54_12700 [Cyanobacteriota bacterium]|nr:hypothetical protein [Cyanobacteriota bacterium]